MKPITNWDNKAEIQNQIHLTKKFIHSAYRVYELKKDEPDRWQVMNQIIFYEMRLGLIPEKIDMLSLNQNPSNILQIEITEEE